MKLFAVIFKRFKPDAKQLYGSTVFIVNLLMASSVVPS